MKRMRTLTPAMLATAALACSPAISQAQFTPVYFDGFDVSAANTNDINFENTTRLMGYVPQTAGPISYVTSTADSTNDYRHQMFAESGLLQLAEDGFNLPMAAPIFSYKTMVSPDYNFTGTTPNGDIIGKRITFSLDVASYMPARDGQGETPGDPNAETYVKAGITVGGNGVLIDDDDEIGVQNGAPESTHFSATFIDDMLNGTGAFMQAYANGTGPVIDGTGCIGCGLNHGGNQGFLNVDIRIDDPSDGNPWDGVGSTEIRVLVDGAQVTGGPENAPWTYVVDNGGLTTNYITLFGGRQLNNAYSNLATHVFDNLTVYAAPAVDVPGDYNYDGVTDAADYTVFRDNEGLVVDLPGLDPNALTPEIDQEDYDYWAANYGSPLPASLSIPEPSTLALLVVSMLPVLRRYKA